MSFLRIVTVGLLIWAGAFSRSTADEAAAPHGTGSRFALLVGVTHYDSLPRDRWLEGPANDVELMHHLLSSSKFNFPESNITILKESADAGRLPTSTNILAALDRLAHQVKSGDQVVVLMAGHGSRAPRVAGKSDTNPEATIGLFLPRDVGTWNSDFGAVDRAIPDYLLSEKANAILKTGASLWLVMDSCHSGGLVRDRTRGHAEVTRDIPAEALGIPKDLLVTASSREKGRTRGHDEGDVAPQQLTSAIAQPNLAVMYACRRSETTPERKFPVDASPPNEGPYGLFTYTLVHVLEQARGPLTYAELVHAINVQYDAWGRPGTPIALVEGKARESFILGSGGGRNSDIRLERNRDGGWTINAGRLRGLNPGSILAVHPPPGSGDEKQVVGHVRVDKSDVMSSDVSPVAYANAPAPAEAALRSEQVCEPVFVDLGLQPLKLFVRVAPGADRAATKQLAEARDKLVEALRGDAQFMKLVTIIDKADAADWLVTLPGDDNDHPFLLEDPTGKLRFPAPAGERAITWLSDSLARIARVRNLKAIACYGGDADIQLSLKVIVQSAAHPEAAPVEYGIEASPVFHDNDKVTFQITNHSEGHSVDVGLIFISSDFEIQSLYPRSGGGAEDNRVSAGKSRSPSARVRANTTGHEEVLLIAVRSDPQKPTADFSFLESRGIEHARGVGGPAVHSPLVDLLYASQRGQGTRGLDSSTPESFTMKKFSWTTAAAQP